MSKSKRGKKATKNLCIKQFKKIIDGKFKDCPFDKRIGLFKGLEEWAYNELGEEQREMFLTALYEADSTQDIQMTLGLEKALSKIEGDKKHG